MYELLTTLVSASQAIVPQAIVPTSPAEMWDAIVYDFSNITEPEVFTAFFKVLMIDIVLAGDNAIIVGALAAGLPPKQRRMVIIIGVAAALVLRIIFVLLVSQLLAIPGLIFVGGLLLVWVCWKMWKDLRLTAPSAQATASADGTATASGGAGGGAAEEDNAEDTTKGQKTFAGAVWAVAVADVTMSLDNVLAVAGAAYNHPGVLIVGLILAIALMGVAANIIAQYIERYRWIAYLGLAVIVWVAGKMLYNGWEDIPPLVAMLVG